MADGFTDALADGRLRTAMESGPPKVRRRFSSAAKPITAQIKLDLEQRIRLDRFWTEETGGGSLPFWMPDQILGQQLATVEGAPLFASSGEPLVCAAWWLVLFGESPPQFAPKSRGISWVASFTLAVLP